MIHPFNLRLNIMLLTMHNLHKAIRISKKRTKEKAKPRELDIDEQCKRYAQEAIFLNGKKERK